MFQLARTFKKPAKGANVQRGFPSPGAGEQTSGPFSPGPRDMAWSSSRPTKGTRTFWDALLMEGRQQGFPSPRGPGQERPAGSMPNTVVPDGMNHQVYTPYFSRGADAFVQNFGKILTNPIGAGVVAQHRPRASYGAPGQVMNGAILWTTQGIPTSVYGQGLTSPQVVAAILGPINVQAAVRRK